MQNRKPAEFNVGPDDPLGNTWALPKDAIARFGTGDSKCRKLSPDGKYLAVGTGVGLWWYDTTSMLPISLWETERGLINSLDFSYDGKWIVTYNTDGILKVMDVQSGTLVTQIEDHSAYAGLAFSPNGKWIATAASNGVVKVMDVQNGECIAQMDRGKHEWKSNDISELDFSPDGKHLAGTVQNPDTEGEETYLWNAETGEVILKFAGRNFVFSADSCLLAAASPDDLHSSSDVKRIDHCVSVWDIKNRERIVHFTEHIDWVDWIAFSPCGKFIASCDKILRVWELATGTQKKVYDNCLDFFYSPDGVLFGVVFPSGDTIEIWNLEPRERVLELPDVPGNYGLAKGLAIAYVREHQFQISEIISNAQANSKKWTLPIEHRIDFATPDPLVVWVDDETLASGSIRQGIVLWDIVEKRVRERLLDDEYIHVFTVLPDGKMLAALVCSQYDATKVWDVSNPEKPIAEFHTNLWWERYQAFSPAGDRMAAGSNDGPVYVWNLRQPDHPMILTGHAKEHIYSLAFSPDGKRLVTGSHDSTARLWDVELGEQITILPMDEPRPPIKVLFSPCGNVIAGGLGSEIRLWCTEQLTTLRTIPQPDNNQRTYALAFSPCGEYLASGTWWEKGMQKMAIRIWEVATGENIRTFWGHNSDVQSLAFSPNGTMLASGGFDGTILVWDLKPYL